MPAPAPRIVDTMPEPEPEPEPEPDVPRTCADINADGTENDAFVSTPIDGMISSVKRFPNGMLVPNRIAPPRLTPSTPRPQVWRVRLTCVRRPNAALWRSSAPRNSLVVGDNIAATGVVELSAARRRCGPFACHFDGRGIRQKNTLNIDINDMTMRLKEWINRNPCPKLPKL